LPKNTDKKKLTHNFLKKAPQKINKDLAEVQLFEAFDVKDDNSKFTIEEGTIMDAQDLLSDFEEETSKPRQTSPQPMLD
jgi:hypothetical protein